jgi:class 3 adenylate cyclase
VLFVDISGFTRMVETVEPEIVYETVRPLMDELVLLVSLYDGEIQQVLGDGFMSVFGLHSWRGDEADRALRAGLALVGACGSHRARPAVHVGIEYGEVLVTPSWEPAGFGLWGRPVNLARRLCDLAGPGEIQVGPAAFTHAGVHFGSAKTVRAQLKGIADTVVGHLVTVDPKPLAPTPLASAR